MTGTRTFWCRASRMLAAGAIAGCLTATATATELPFGDCGGFLPMGVFPGSEPSLGGVRLVSNDGLRVAGASRVNSVFRPWIWSPGTGYEAISVSEGLDFYPWAMSGDGSVIWLVDEDLGLYRWVDGVGVFPVATPPNWDKVYVNSASYDGTVAAGQAWDFDAGTAHAFRWTSTGGFEDLGSPGGSFDDDHHGRAVSADGTIVSGYSGIGNNTISWRWTAQTGMQLLPLAPGTMQNYATVMTPDGMALAGGSDTDIPWRWSGQDGFTMLPKNQMIETSSISADGMRILGRGNGQWWMWANGTMQTLEEFAASQGVSLSAWPGTFSNPHRTRMTPNGLVVVGTRNLSQTNTDMLYWMQLRDPNGSCPQCDGDLNGDGTVSFDDLLILLSGWGPCPEEGNCLGDFPGPGGFPNGQVDFEDLVFLLNRWGDCPAP